METKRSRYNLLNAQLDNERSSFVSHWRLLGDNINPRRTRFFVSDANRGDRRNNKIIDTTPTLAARTLRSGMMSGITSPARPWFRLSTPDPSMAEFGKVKNWLSVVSQRMTAVFLRSNLYNVLPILYGDMGVFATGAILVDQDLTDVIRCYSFPIGSYKIAKDYSGKVNTFSRDFRMTVRQLIDQFGERDAKTGVPKWDIFSDFVRNEYERGNYETWIDVCHIVQPNEEYDPRKALAKYKKYSSCYYEAGTTGAGERSYLTDYEQDIFLRESGYDFFPVLAPRWEVSGEDVYGTSCPGMEALGDILALQIMQKRKAQAVEKIINPPMIAPIALQTKKVSLLPGDVTYSDEREGTKGLRSAYDINFRVSEVMADIQEHQNRIRRAFYEDLFLMISSLDRRDITAREIDARHEERLLALGPVLEQLNQDLLDPLIDITFNNMVQAGQVPRPPDELQGVELKVEYISVMAQAQKLAGISGIERFTGFVGQLAQTNPVVLDKINMDQLIDVYSDITSIPPGIVRTDDEVESIRQGRAQAQQAQAQAQVAEQAASTAKQLSETDMESDSALTRLLQQSNAGQLARTL